MCECEEEYIANMQEQEYREQEEGCETDNCTSKELYIVRMLLDESISECSEDGTFVAKEIMKMIRDDEEEEMKI